MPYAPFLAAAKTARYDIELLTHRFGVSFEQVCHRLSTLQRPGAKGVPFYLVRVDIAGNISKRFSAAGFHFSRFGGSCPRWVVHEAFMTPGLIRTQVAQLPDGTTFFCIARTLTKESGAFNQPQTQMAIGIGCELGHARELVYADAYDLDRVDRVSDLVLEVVGVGLVQQGVKMVQLVAVSVAHVEQGLADVVGEAGVHPKGAHPPHLRYCPGLVVRHAMTAVYADTNSVGSPSWRLARVRRTTSNEATAESGRGLPRATADTASLPLRVSLARAARAGDDADHTDPSPAHPSGAPWPSSPRRVQVADGPPRPQEEAVPVRGRPEHDPADRTYFDWLVVNGFFVAVGDDWYELTDKGRAAADLGSTSGSRGRGEWPAVTGGVRGRPRVRPGPPA